MSEDLFGERLAAPRKKLSPSQVRTQRAKLRIDRGFHPFGLRLRDPPGETCGSCGHCRDREYAKRYFKCALVGSTRSEATDLRKSWPACEKWVTR